MPSADFLVVVSYDISDDARRRKASRVLRDYGIRVQFSVFECLLAAKRCREMERKLAKILTGQDSIRYYRLCASCVREIKAEGKGSDLAAEEIPPVIVV